MGEACSDEAEEHSFSSLPLASNPFSFVTEIFHLLVELFPPFSPQCLCRFFISYEGRRRTSKAFVLFFPPRGAKASLKDEFLSEQRKITQKSFRVDAEE
jgi:hypothetical protein